MFPQMSSPGSNDASHAAAEQVVEEPASDATLIPPDLAMLNIFSRIPFFDLLSTIPQTSPQLAELKAEACRQRRNLTLLLGADAERLLKRAINRFENLPPIDPLSMMVFYEKRLVPAATRELTRSLVNITSLTVSMSRVEDGELLQLIQLLFAWADQLTALVIIFRNDDSDSDSGTIFKLFSIQPFINNLSRLRHLTLMFYYIDDTDRNISFDLPVMAHLESFNYYLDCHKLFIPSMSRYFVNNQQARSIDMGHPIYQTWIEHYLELPPSVCRLFSKLYIDHLHDPQLLRFCEHFGHLRSLELNFLDGRHTMLPLLARRLRSLTSLTDLGLGMNDFELHLEAIEEERLLLPPGTLQVLEALPTVTSFRLRFIGYINSHDQLAALHFEQMLPNLEKLFINGEYYYCTNCGIEQNEEESYGDEDGEEDDEENLPLVQHLPIEERTACFVQMLSPIRPLFGRLQLTQIGFDVYEDEPTIITLP